MKGQADTSARIGDKRQLVAGKRLTLDDRTQVVGEMLERRERTGLEMKVFEIEAPAPLLATAMFAHETIKPTVKAAREIEIGPVDGEDQSVVNDAGIEPVCQDEFYAERPAARVQLLFPFGDP